MSLVRISCVLAWTMMVSCTYRVYTIDLRVIKNDSNFGEQEINIFVCLLQVLALQVSSLDEVDSEDARVRLDN